MSFLAQMKQPRLELRPRPGIDWELILRARACDLIKIESRINAPGQDYKTI